MIQMHLFRVLQDEGLLMDLVQLASDAAAMVLLLHL